MEKLNFRYIELRLTRKCQLNCPHCFCGKAQDVDMTPAIIDQFLSQTASINKLRLMGGEPLLNLSVIEYLVEQLEERKMRIGSIGLYTNGIICNKKVVKVMNRLIELSDNKSECFYRVSVDRYHNPTEKILDNFNFYKEKTKNREVEFTLNYAADKQLAYSGSATTLKIIDKVIFPPTYRNLEWVDDQIQNGIYLNSKGYYYPDTMISYEVEDYDNCKFAISGVSSRDSYNDFIAYNNKKEVKAIRTLEDDIRKLMAVDFIRCDRSEINNQVNELEKKISILDNILNINDDYNKNYIESLRSLSNTEYIKEYLDYRDSELELFTKTVKTQYPNIQDDKFILETYYTLKEQYKILDEVQSEQFSDIPKEEKQQGIAHIKNNIQQIEDSLGYVDYENQFIGYRQIHKDYPKLTPMQCALLENAIKQLNNKHGEGWKNPKYRGSHLRTVRKLTGQEYRG